MTSVLTLGQRELYRIYTYPCSGRIHTCSNVLDTVTEELRSAADNGSAVVVETVPDDRGQYALHGWPEFVGKVPPSSLLAPLRAVAAAHAARHWQNEGVHIVGVRAWMVDTGCLGPLYYSVDADAGCWSRSVATAHCRRCSRSPSPDCECGLYAVRPEHPQRVPANDDVLAVGIVELFGRVIPYEAGWRAERARILEVWVPEGSAIDYDRYPGVTWHTL